MSTLAEAAFRAGVTACLRSWSALRTAVEGGWGGIDSQQKADDLRNNIYQFLNIESARPSLELEDLEDNLAIYLEEEFSVVLEDSSERQVAETLFQLFAECVEGKTALAEQLVQTALKYDEQIAAAYPVYVQSTEQDDDDDDEGMMDTATADGAACVVSMISQQQQPPISPVVDPAEYAAQPLFGKVKKPKEPRQAKDEPVVEMDEDGFAPVTKSRRRPRP